jgi:hypothetical protein
MRPPGAWETRPSHEPSLQIHPVTVRAIADSWSGLETIGWEAEIDGAPFVAERGVDGDHRFVHGAPPDHSGTPSTGTLAIHHLSSDASVLQCAPANPADPLWWRVVLDSVLFTAALLRGYEALHAGAIATPGGVMAITAGTGGGKSTLLAELLERGSGLVADDVLMLEARSEASPLAHPAPPLMTVPGACMPLPSTAGPWETIASIDDERWIAVPTYPEPLPMKALVVLDRRPQSQWPSAQPSLTKVESPLAVLLSALMAFPAAPERQQARFELASALAATCGLWQLTARLDTPAKVLADTLLSADL